MSVASKLSVEAYEQMIRQGILTENDPVELIRGEIVPKMPIGSSHLAAVNRLNRILNRRLGASAAVSIQNPILLVDSEPEPDVALLVPRDDDYVAAKPRASDVFLVIEVADSSLDFDRTTKLALYAEAGIREYWIVNLVDEQIEVFRQPQPNGVYRDVQTLRRGEELELLAFPGEKLAIGDLLN